MSRESKLKYLELKSQLTDLNYTEPFKEELLKDLISTTNAYKLVQEKEVRIAKDLALSQAQLFPLRKENARIARDNHDLHADTIRLNDDLRNAEDNHSREMQKVQEHLQDSRFQCEALNAQLREKEEKLDKLRMLCGQLQDPSLRGPSGSAGPNGSRAIKMPTKLSGPGGNVAELSALHHPPAASTSGVTAAALNEKDAVIRTLRAQLEAANKACAAKDEENRRVASALTAREQELARSSKLITSTTAKAATMPGASVEVSSHQLQQSAVADVANARIVNQLNGQIDFLNEQLAQKEAQLAECYEKVALSERYRIDLQNRSQQLEEARRDLRDSNAKNRALEQRLLESRDTITEYSAALEIANSASVGGGASIGGPGSVSGESKGEGAGRDGELKLILGKVSAERDELREEVARLRRITSTLTLGAGGPVSPSSATTSPTGKPVVSRVGAAGTGVNGRGQGRGASTGRAAAAAAGGRVAEDKRQQVAAHNVLVMELNAEVERMTKEKHTLERAVKQREEHITALTMDRDSLKERLLAADSAKDKSVLQTLHHELQEKYALCQEQLATSNRKLSQLQDFLSASAGDLENVRQRQLEAQVAREDAEARLAVLSKELQLLKQSLQRKDADLQATTREGSELRLANDDLRAALQSMTARYEAAQRLQAEAHSLLEAKTAELAEVSHELALARAGSTTAFGGSDVESQLREDRRRLQDRVRDLEAAEVTAQRERRGLVHVAQSLGVQIQQERAARGLEEEQVTQVLEALARRERELVQLQGDLRESKAALQRLQSALEQQENSSYSLNSEVAELQQTCQQRSQQIAQLRSDLSLAEQRYSDLLAHYETAREDQATTDQQRSGIAQQLALLRKDLQAQSEASLQLQQALGAAEDQRDHARRLVDEHNRRAKADRADLAKALDEKKAAEQKCEQLQTLVNTLEAATRRELQKQRSLAAEVERGEADLQTWEREQSTLRTALDDRDAKLRTLQECLQRVDREKDELEERYEQLEESLQQARTAQKHQELQSNAQKALLDATERKVQTVTADLTAAQRHAHAADARLNAAQLEIAELKRRLGQKSVEVGGAAQDLLLMTRENQALNSELVQVSAERDGLQKRLQQVLQASAGTEHARRAAEVEKTDLMNTYRAVLHEKRKLEEDITNLSNMKERDGLAVQQLQEKLMSLQGTLGAQSAAESRWRGERTALLAQLDTLNEHLVRAQHKIDGLEADNRKMVQDTNGLKQNNIMLNERINMIIRRAGAATEANKLLTGRLGAVERERDAVRALVGVERQRTADLAHVAEAARVEAAAKDMHLQRMRAVASARGDSLATEGTARVLTSAAEGASSSQYASNAQSQRYTYTTSQTSTSTSAVRATTSRHTSAVTGNAEGSGPSSAEGSPSSSGSSDSRGSSGPQSENT